jgi:cobalt-precorrin-5B (C1)-methyltransferase
MILVFGGTTEGRKAVEVLEEAGKPYYYSTRSDGQQIELVNGIHLTGGMEVPEMMACCRSSRGDTVAVGTGT